MKIKILYFAQLRDAAGLSEEWIDCNAPIKVADLVRILLERPAFQRFQKLPLSYAINQEFVDSETLVPDLATVALLPPFAGG